MSENYKVYKGKLTDLKPDTHNPNAGTERGAYMTARSAETLGAGRSLVADKDGRLVAGNKMQEAFIDTGFDDVLIVETDGTLPVVHKRRDWDLSEPGDNPARQYSVADNQTALIGIEWDAAALQDYQLSGIELGDWFNDFELADMGIRPPGGDGAGEDGQTQLGQKSPVTCPECGNSFIPE